MGQSQLIVAAAIALILLSLWLTGVLSDIGLAIWTPDDHASEPKTVLPTPPERKTGVK